MAKVEFLGPINIDSLDIDVKSIKELANVLKEMPQMQVWLENSAVAVNNHIISELNVPLKESDTVTILPPVCGG